MRDPSDGETEAQMVYVTAPGPKVGQRPSMYSLLMYPFQIWAVASLLPPSSLDKWLCLRLGGCHITSPRKRGDRETRKVPVTMLWDSAFSFTSSQGWRSAYQLFLNRAHGYPNHHTSCPAATRMSKPPFPLPSFLPWPILNTVARLIF